MNHSERVDFVLTAETTVMTVVLVAAPALGYHGPCEQQNDRSVDRKSVV